MGDQLQNTEIVTKRFKSLVCSEEEKFELGGYLFSCLADGNYYRLKRDRVMICEQNHKLKFLVLDIAKTAVDDKHVYVCPKCSPIDFSKLLTNVIPPDQYKSCVHTKVCKLLWGELHDICIGVVDDDKEDTIEVLEEKPRYLAVVHPSRNSAKKPGVILQNPKT